MTNKTLTMGIAASALLGGLAAIVLTLVWGAAWGGFTLSVLWGWFVVPLFGLPALSIAQAFGLALVVRSANDINSQSEKSKDGLSTAIMRLFFLPPLLSELFLLLGLAAKAWA